MIPKEVFICMVFFIVGYILTPVQGQAKYECSGTEGPCILLDVNATFTLAKIALHPKIAKAFDLNDAFVEKQQCVCAEDIYKERRMVLKLQDSGETIEWNYHVEETTVKLDLVFNLIPNKHFTNESGSIISLKTMSEINLSDVTESYVCFSDKRVVFTENAEFKLTADLTGFHVQAFTVTGGHFGPVGKRCPGDLRSSTVPTSSTYSSDHSTYTSPTQSSSSQPTSSHTYSTSTLQSTTHTKSTTSTKPSTLTSSSPVTSPFSSTYSTSVTTMNSTIKTPHTTSAHTVPSTKLTPTRFSSSVQTSSTPITSSTSPSTKGSTRTSFMTSLSTRLSTQSSFTPTGSTSHKVPTSSQPTTRPTTSVITTQVTTPASVLPKFGLKDPDGQYYCIVLQGNIEFEIPYTTTDGNCPIHVTLQNVIHYKVSDISVLEASLYGDVDGSFHIIPLHGWLGAANVTGSNLAIELPRNASVTGSCSVNGTNNTQEITISFFDGWSFNLVIGTLTDETGLTEHSTYSWEEIDLTYVLDDHFYQPKEKGKQMEVSASPAFDDFKARSQGCFKCISRQAIILKTVTLDLSDLEYFGFGQTDSEDFPTADVSECAADHTQTTMSPSTKSPSKGHGGAIAGGIVGGLAALGLIALAVIAYRRRKNKALPYEDL